MMTTVNLTPDLGSRVVAEADRVGVTPKRLVTRFLDRHFPAGRRAAAIALLDSWLAETDTTEQRETGDALMQGLDAGRPGQRPHFPP
jgi:hypothetical protein